MNLADPKRLSCASLEGLARLLELLTNYFKVEIGHRLLDHYRFLADANMLKDAVSCPLEDNEEITKLVRLVNIIHLLPAAANCFLEDLVNLVVSTEAQLHCANPSPFSLPLSKFLDRYPEESVEYFLNNLGQPRHVRTLRNVLLSGHSPLLLKEFHTQTLQLVTLCFGEDRSLLIPGLQICGDFIELTPHWLEEHPEVLEALLALWRVEFGAREQTSLQH